jgi:chaperonin GroES
MAKKKKALRKSAKKAKNTAKRGVSKTAQTAVKSGLVPFGDRVLVRPFEADELDGKKNNFGIIIPDTVSKEKSMQGRVLAVGDGKYEDGKLLPIKVKVGDRIVFSKYGYDEVEFGDEELYLIKEDSILAIVR